MSQPKTILMIEDEPDLRRSVSAYLEDSGYVVLQAGDGRAGVELFTARKPDLVLTDLRMPELNGVEVVTRVKQASPGTPVIVLTGTGDQDAQAEALRRGAQVCLVKPIKDLAALETAIAQALAETSSS